MKVKTKKKRILRWSTVLGVCLSLVCLLIMNYKNHVNAETVGIWNKNKNTAYISEKSAKWVDKENYLAELTLKVNGITSIESLDVVVVLDRSGSMDMNYIHEFSDGNGATKGTHVASSPCLNQNHFYFEETEEVATEIPNSTDDMHYDEATQRLTVYNGEKQQWVVLDTSEKKHLYFQFGNLVSDPTSMALAAYHFKEENGNYVRISKWDTNDIRKGSNPGVWDHADEEQGCYDRWIEAKKAIVAFADELLQMNEQNGLTGDAANKVAFVPFSIRDETMLYRLNSLQPQTKQWLLDNHYFDGSGIQVDGNGDLVGEYQTRVGWTDDLSDITSVVPNLFTSACTDYVYGLGEAYNLLESRSDTAKANKRAVVLFLSDGTPDPLYTYRSDINEIYAFCNYDKFINPIANAIKADTTEIEKDSMWAEITGLYQRHSVHPDSLARDENNAIIGAYGQDVNIVSVGYMLNSQDSITRMRNIASIENNYINIPADATGSPENYLTDQLLDNLIRPGGRNAVLRDKISEYYYVPEDAKLPNGVSIEGDIEAGQTIVWNIGDIYHFDKANEPTIKIPLVLKEAYRDVKKTTYYPTNDDNPKPDLTTPTPGEDGKDTGAKLEYLNPGDQAYYDTIGTPKLEVEPVQEPPVKPTPPNKPSVAPDPDPQPPKPQPQPHPQKPDELVDIVMKPSISPVLGDTTRVLLYSTVLLITIIGISIIGVTTYKRKKLK